MDRDMKSRAGRLVLGFGEGKKAKAFGWVRQQAEMEIKWGRENNPISFFFSESLNFPKLSLNEFEFSLKPSNIETPMLQIECNNMYLAL